MKWLKWDHLRFKVYAQGMTTQKCMRERTWHDDRFRHFLIICNHTRLCVYVGI